MVKICGSDIPNLSNIVNETFDAIGDIYTGNALDFDDIDTDADISMNDNLEDYIPDMSDD
jgi:hypothetical protein